VIHIVMNLSTTPVFDNSYASLPERFFTRLSPVPVSSPGLIRVNRPLARYLGFDPDWLESEQGIAMVGGNFLPPGADPIASVYAGHQFGGWSPQLGDGRAILLGEVIAEDGVRHDIQLKGSGRTPYSRGGDGRAPLGPVLREYVVSEAMASMGVPTSRALAAVTTGDWVIREGRLPGAVLARVARSHIRIGTLQFFAARQDFEALKVLVQHVIDRHYPLAAQSENPVNAMLEAIIARQASLIAQWQLLGFIHGVMNTDNMLLSGETIDYGPCAFMDVFDPATVFSFIDRDGRYAYQNQAPIAHWNLSVLTNTLLPILHDDQETALALGQAAIDAYPGLYQAAYGRGLLRKLGLTGSHAEHLQLGQDLLTLMAEERTDYTLTFRHLADLVNPLTPPEISVHSLIELPDSFGHWLQRWRQAIKSEQVDAHQRQADMYAANPACIPRNHLVQEVIDAAVDQQNFEPFHALVDKLQNPEKFESSRARYATPPRPDQMVTQTFCGT
jgi:uncharacterized protein YdiU (UPF0061 family)